MFVSHSNRPVARAGGVQDPIDVQDRRCTTVGQSSCEVMTSAARVDEVYARAEVDVDEEEEESGEAQRKSQSRKLGHIVMSNHVGRLHEHEISGGGRHVEQARSASPSTDTYSTPRRMALDVRQVRAHWLHRANALRCAQCEAGIRPSRRSRGESSG